MRPLDTIPIIAALILGACVSVSETEPSADAVMRPGMYIHAETRFGILQVDYVDVKERRYRWRGNDKSFKLRSTGGVLMGNKGDKTMNVFLREGRRDFADKEALLSWLESREQNMDFSWNASGLAVGWKTDANPESELITLVAEVWQLTVQGASPEELEPNGMVRF